MTQKIEQDDVFNVEVSVDIDTGKIEATYDLNGVICKKHLIEGPLATRYMGLTLIGMDLKDAQDWLQLAYGIIGEPQPKSDQTDRFRILKLDDKGSQKVLKSLYFSSLIFYGKCFIQAKGRKVMLNRSNIPKEYRSKHDEIMNLRHTVAAHSGEGVWDAGDLFYIQPIDIRYNNIDLRTVPLRLDFSDDRNDAQSFSKLIQLVIKEIEIKKQKVADKISKKIIIPKGKKYWYELEGS